MVKLDENNKIATRESFGKKIAEIGKKNKKIVVLDSDLKGSNKTDIFAKEFPERFLEMGISEADMIGTAAGLASCGKIPFASSFAVFATGRAYDQIRQSVAHTNLNVKIVGTHAGLTVGEDGATHQMLEDIGLMTGLPNMTVLCPSDDTQTRWAIEEASKIEGPVYIRTARVKTPVIYDENEKFEIGKSVQIGDGEDATIFATGVTVYEALKAQKELKEKGINIRVVDMYSIKPIDEEMIIKCAKETKQLISIEDHSTINGLGSAISNVLTEQYPKKLIKLGVKDDFGQSGKPDELLRFYEIDSNAICKLF